MIVAQDAWSGTKIVSLGLLDPNSHVTDLNLTLVTGDIKIGNWEVVYTFLPTDPHGTWGFSYVYMQDYAGNNRTYPPSQGNSLHKNS